MTARATTPVVGFVMPVIEIRVNLAHHLLWPLRSDYSQLAGQHRRKLLVVVQQRRFHAIFILELNICESFTNSALPVSDHPHTFYCSGSAESTPETLLSICWLLCFGSPWLSVFTIALVLDTLPINE